MAKDVNIHLKSTGVEQTQQDMDKTAKSVKGVDDTTEKAGAKSSRAASAFKNAFASIVGPLGIAAITAGLAPAAVGVARFFDDLKQRSDQAVQDVQRLRDAYTSLYEATNAFSEESRQTVAIETNKTLMKTGVSEQTGLPVIDAYTRQFHGLVDSGKLSEEDYKRGQEEILGYAERHGGDATSELISIIRGWGMNTPEQQGEFRRISLPARRNPVLPMKMLSMRWAGVCRR